MNEKQNTAPTIQIKNLQRHWNTKFGLKTYMVGVNANKNENVQ